MQFAAYCENGHRLCFTDPDSEEWEKLRPENYLMDLQGNPVPKFCADCGAKAINKCPHCDSLIHFNEYRMHYVPNYCRECGAMFPWVSSALQELDRVTDEAKEFTEEEKTALKLAFPELTKNTSKTRGAMETLKALYVKFSPGAMAIVRPVLINVLTDEGKQGLSAFFPHK